MTSLPSSFRYMFTDAFNHDLFTTKEKLSDLEHYCQYSSAWHLPIALLRSFNILNLPMTMNNHSIKSHLKDYTRIGILKLQSPRQKL